MLPLNPCICQCIRQFFIKRPKFLAAISNLCVGQNLVHLGRFLHFSQKVVGVTLMNCLPIMKHEVDVSIVLTQQTLWSTIYINITWQD